MSDVVRVVVKVVARSDTAAAVKAIVLKLGQESRKEAGCIVYDVLEDMADPALFVLVEEWESVAALDAHGKTPHFHEAVASAVPLLAKPLEVSRLRAIL